MRWSTEHNVESFLRIGISKRPDFLDNTSKFKEGSTLSCGSMNEGVK